MAYNHQIYYYVIDAYLDMLDEDPTADVSAFAFTVARTKKEVSIYKLFFCFLFFVWLVGWLVVVIKFSCD